MSPQVSGLWSQVSPSTTESFNVNQRAKTRDWQGHLLVAGIALVFLSSVGAVPDAEDWTRIYAVESPTLSTDGSEVSFTWCGTNWVAAATGGTARVTAKAPKPFDAGPFTNEIYEAMGQDATLSPDATRVAFRFRGDNYFRRRNGTVSSRAGEIWLYDGRTKTYTNLVRRTGGGSRRTVRRWRTTVLNRTCAWTTHLPNGRAASTRSSRKSLKSSPRGSSFCLSHSPGYEILTALCKNLSCSSCFF